MKLAIRLSLLFMALLPCRAAITLFGSSSTPTDNGSNTGSGVTITPPSSMVAGDVAIVTVQVRQTGLGITEVTITNAGGQSWMMMDLDSGNTNLSFRVFACTFNGTWSANPIFDGLVSTSVTGKMDVIRPSDASHSIDVGWSLIENGTTFASGTAITATGITTRTAGELVYVCWMTTAARTWTSLTAGWTYAGGNQIRNTAGSDESISCAYQVFSAAGATGNISNTMNTATAGAYFIMSWTEHTAYLSSVPTVDLYSDLENSTAGTTATATILTNGTHPTSSPGCTWAATGGTQTTMTVQTTAEHLMGKSLIQGGTTYNDVGSTRGWQYDHTNGTNTGTFDCTFGSNKSKVSYGFFFKTTYQLQTFDFYTSMAMFSTPNQHFTAFNFVAQYVGSYYSQLETDGGTVMGPELQPSTWYYATVLYDGSSGTAKLAVFQPDSSWAQLGFASVQALTAEVTSRFEILGTGGTLAAVTGTTLYDDILIDYTSANWPLGPATPAATGGTSGLLLLGAGK